jgi:hypothetical protein
MRSNHFILKFHDIRHALSICTYIDAVMLVLIERVKYVLWSLNQRWLHLIYWDGGCNIGDACMVAY